MLRLRQSADSASVRRRPDSPSPGPIDFGYLGPLFAVVALVLMAVVIYFRFLA